MTLKTSTASRTVATQPAVRSEAQGALKSVSPATLPKAGWQSGAVSKSSAVMAQSMFEPATTQAPMMLAQAMSARDQAENIYDSARENMPGRNGHDSPFGGTINDLAQPFVEFGAYLGFPVQVPKNCSEQALYMADQFKANGFNARIHYSDGHAWFSVVVDGQRLYGDTWKGWQSLDSQSPDTEVGSYDL
jgi:hypothetical protein